MRSLLNVWMVLALFGTLVGWAEETTETPPSVEQSKAIGLVAIGDVDAATMEQLRVYVEQNVFFPVRLLPARKLAGGGLDEEGLAAVKDLDPSLVCLVAVVMPEENIENHGVFLPEHKFAVVNAKAIRPNAADEEIYFRRIRRGVMRGVGMLAGLETCPNPQCCLSSYANLEQLDHIGNNFCPPCLDRVTDGLSRMGLKMIDFPVE